MPDVRFIIHTEHTINPIGVSQVDILGKVSCKIFMVIVYVGVLSSLYYEILYVTLILMRNG